MLKKIENNVGASLLDAVGDGEAARQRPILLYLTLEEDGEKFWGTVHHG